MKHAASITEEVAPREQGAAVVDRILGQQEVCQMINLGHSALNALEAAGNFPRRVKIGHGQRRVSWWLSEVQAWIAKLGE